MENGLSITGRLGSFCSEEFLQDSSAFIFHNTLYELRSVVQVRR